MNKLFDLSGKTALITGASGGLGEQFARTLSAVGARVILTGRRLDALQDLASNIENSFFLEMDVSNKLSVQSAFERFEMQKERIDICINNAGIAKLTPIFEQDDRCNFEEVIQSNVMGVWYVAKSVANHMKNHEIHGSIINMGSVNGDILPAKTGSAYSISKAAVIHLTKTLVQELSSQKIRINCISPGWFKTSMIGQDGDKVAPLIPQGKIGLPRDLDGLILYLASNTASAYVTGACFTIDGGVSCGMTFE